MNARVITALSVLLNLALCVGIASVLRHRVPPPAKTEIESIDSSAKVTSIVPEPVQAPARPPEPEVEDFDWSRVRDADFKTYRDQLLAIGCPENTVRVILLAEINQLFGERRRSALASLQAQFWDLIGQGPDKLEKMAREVGRPIEEERRKLIDELLGDQKADPAAQAADKERAAAAERARYAWLPEEKREQLAALDRQLQEANTEMWRLGRENKDRQPTAEAKARQKELEQQLKQARKQLLTAEEFDEYELRASGAANWAWNAAGFEPTEAEWREVARLQKQRDDVLTELNANKPANDEQKKARAAETQRLNDELAKAREAALGPERSAEYARAGDRDFQQVRSVTRKYGLDDAVAAQVYELQRVALKQAEALRHNQSLDADARALALAAIREETERTLGQTMGAKAFNTYQKYDEGWFSRLGRQ